MLVLGVDPGTVCTGWSLFEDKELIKCDKLQYPSSWDQSKRLAHLMWGIETVLDEYSPKVLVIEDQFVGLNARASLVTARAKGIVIAAAAMRGIKVIEYAPMEIKKAVTGIGNASKELLTQTILSLYHDSNIVKSIGEYCDKGKNKNDDIYDSIGIGHTYWVLGEEKTVIIKDKKSGKTTSKTVSRVI